MLDSRVRTFSLCRPTAARVVNVAAEHVACPGLVATNAEVQGDTVSLMKGDN